MSPGFYIRRDVAPGRFDDRHRWFTNGFGWSPDRAKAKRFFDFDEAWKVAIIGDRVVSITAEGKASVSMPKDSRHFHRNSPGRYSRSRIPGISHFLREAEKFAAAASAPPSTADPSTTIEAEMLRRGEAALERQKPNDSAAGSE